MSTEIPTAAILNAANTAALDEIATLRARLREVERERMSLDAQLAESERQADALRRECAQWQRVAHKVETERSEAVRERVRLDELCDAFRDASGLIDDGGGDPGGITPRNVEEHVRGMAHALDAIAFATGPGEWKEPAAVTKQVLDARAEAARLTARLAEVEAGAARKDKALHLCRDVIGALTDGCELGSNTDVMAAEMNATILRALLPGGGA